MREDLFNSCVMQLDNYIMFALKEKTAKLKDELTARNRAPISLAMGAPTAQPPEFAINRLKEVLAEEDIHTYSTPKGEIYFRKAVVQRMKNRFGVDIDPETEVFSLIGSKEGIANLIRALINPCNGEIILVPDPGYASYREFIKCSGGIAHPIPLTAENNYMPDMEEVLACVDAPHKVKAMIMNYPNNPLGAVATREYVKSVVNFCKKHGILLISDAAYCDLYFDEAAKPFSVFEIDGAKDIALEFFSFSKPYALTGWRVGWVCGNREAILRFGRAKSTVDNGIFKALQITCADILNSKECDEYITRENENYKRKQAFMVKGFKGLGYPIGTGSPDILDKAGNNTTIFTPPPATFYLWLPVPPRYENSFKFCEEVLEKSGIVLIPGSAFGTCGEGFFRVSIVCSQAQLQTVIDRFKEDGFQY